MVIVLIQLYVGGDRDSFLWELRKDKKIMSSIPYDRYKGKNVDIDVELISVFKNYL